MPFTIHKCPRSTLKKTYINFHFEPDSEKQKALLLKRLYLNGETSGFQLELQKLSKVRATRGGHNKQHHRKIPLETEFRTSSTDSLKQLPLWK